MKRTLLLPATCLLFLFVCSNTAFSQDDIIMLNDNVIKAKVEEIGINVIKYRKADNLDGPVYDVPKSDVYMIVYNNGTRDVINPRQGDAPQANAQQTNDVVETQTPRVAPPEIPVYEQPACPVEGYLWTPGYWAFGPYGYYWVPGVWISPPYAGYLWTPGYWGYENGYYGWHEGYWGEHVGYYGGVYYGYGYEGMGYGGGRWEGGVFRYNTAVSRVDVTIVHTTYEDRTVVRNTTVVNRASYNGEGGVRAEPTTNERLAMKDYHINPTTEQQTHVTTARSDRSQYASANHGQPAVTSMNKANGEHFTSQGHVTTVTNATNSAHPMQTEQHTNQTEQSHSAQQPTQQQHTTQPVQPRTEESTQQQHTSQPVQSHTEQPTTQQQNALSQPIQQQHSAQQNQAPVQKNNKTNMSKPVQRSVQQPTQKPTPVKKEEHH